jgi:hypothetical protein
MLSRPRSRSFHPARTRRKARPDGPNAFDILMSASGSSSVVERQLPKLNVAGSIPVSRSKTSGSSGTATTL